MDANELRAATERYRTYGLASRSPASPYTEDVRVLADAYLAGPHQYDDAHPPTEPGLYYQETSDPYGNPRPGLMFWESGKPWEPPGIPTKYFGPIPGAFKPWPMVPLSTKETPSHG